LKSAFEGVASIQMRRLAQLAGLVAGFVVGIILVEVVFSNNKS
jgi:hypothetical protein